MRFQPANIRVINRRAGSSTVIGAAVRTKEAGFAPLSIRECGMTSWENWVRHPQTLWVRKALFQIHRWTGIGVGVYVLVMSVSGSLIVYRDELARAFSRAPVIVASQGPRMTPEDLKRAAQRRHSEYKLTKVYEWTNPNQAVEITFERGGKPMERLFNPYTGADLGYRLRTGFRLVLWLVDLYDNLLSGQTGRLVNGIGGLFFTILALTGSMIWWPGFGGQEFRTGGIA